MNEQYLNAQNLTINDLSVKLADETTAKNLLAIQLSEANETIAILQAKLKEFEENTDKKGE